MDDTKAVAEKLYLAEKSVTPVSGSRGLSPAPSPLGTVHETFASHGSGVSESGPCGAARLCHFLIASALIRRSRIRLSEIILLPLSCLRRAK